MYIHDNISMALSDGYTANKTEGDVINDIITYDILTQLTDIQ